VARHALFAWELGGGYGHVTRVLPIAAGIMQRGHRVTLALRDVATAGAAAGPMFAGAQGALIEAPAWPRPQPAAGTAGNYAELLLLNGLADADGVRALVAAWLDMFARTRPDLLIAEAAPAAMLAARVAGLPVALIGVGWSLPPRTTPLPPLQPWDALPAQRLAAAEARMLGIANTALAALGAAPLGRLADLFDATAQFLCTFAELDHYEGRTDADYYGAIYDRDGGVPPQWPRGNGPPVFAYVSAGNRLFAPLLAALGMLGMPTVLHARNRRGTVVYPANVWLADGPMQVGAALASCRVAICQGHGTLAAALLAGRPVLLLPQHPEQVMLLARVMRQGLGLGVAVDADAAAIAATLQRLLHEPAYTERAQSFAARYHGYEPSIATTAIAEDCCEILLDAG
jgi:UDP:flavonoid glycosyltransferase YjiC (YdhE family)